MAESNRQWMRFQWRMHKLIWNLSGGRLGRRVIGMPVLELVTIGHKSGQERQILITYVGSDDAPMIVGTNAGRDVDPAWVRNLRANPQARMRLGGQWREVEAHEPDGVEYAAAWDQAMAASPGYAAYAKELTRPIPIFRLDAVHR
jgi:deazaflavin-dependent oxidoreductase (nitroreductase family)